jgi:hypothetical protein
MGFGKWWKQSPVTTVSNIGSSVDDEIFQPVSNELAGLDDFVNENVPGGWAGVILIAAGVYYAPEIGAYLSADGAVIGTTEGLTAEQIAVANASADPIAAANELAAWTQTQAAAATAAEAAAAQVAAEQAASQVAAEQLAAQQAAANVTSSVSAEALAAANATADPLGALIAEQGWSVVDPTYLASIGVTEGMAPAVTSAISKGLTFKQATDIARAGLLVNAITGDPLGLAGEQPSGGGGGFTGFAQVPIPADWRSPTYAASSAPIDLSSIFTDQNLLAGTQWQGLPQQQNISFNDIFASGQQQTPMGQPVDINQIVSAILGQNTASQKPA